MVLCLILFFFKKAPKMAILKGVQKKTWFWILVVLISQLLYIVSLKFLCLPHIIGGVLWGVGTRILKIRCIEAEIWAKQKFKTKVFICTPFSNHDKIGCYGQHCRYGILWVGIKYGLYGVLFKQERNYRSDIKTDCKFN